MLRNYKIVFKLPCEKVISFILRIFGDDYNPTVEVGHYPSRYFVDNYLLYVPELQDYCGSEISNGIVVSVCEKKNGDIKSSVFNDKTETKPSLKSLYWKNGYIFKTREHGYGVISNDVLFCAAGSLHKFDLDDSLLMRNNIPGRANDIIEVWNNSSTRGFNPHNAEEVHKCCQLVWSRPIKMSREEIEKKLNMPKGSLIVTD